MFIIPFRVPPVVINDLCIVSIVQSQAYYRVADTETDADFRYAQIWVDIDRFDSVTIGSRFIDTERYGLVIAGEFKLDSFELLCDHA